MNYQPFVLVVEVDPDDATLLKVAFQEVAASAEVEFLQDGQQAIYYLAGRGFIWKSFPIPVAGAMNAV